jgi:hypothetical protein
VCGIRAIQLLKWKYYYTLETFLEVKKAAIRGKIGREIRHKNWINFCKGLDKIMNISYSCDVIKRITIVFNKIEREYDHKLVTSVKKLLNRYAWRWMTLCKHWQAITIIVTPSWSTQ